LKTDRHCPNSCIFTIFPLFFRKPKETHMSASMDTRTKGENIWCPLTITLQINKFKRKKKKKKNLTTWKYIYIGALSYPFCKPHDPDSRVVHKRHSLFHQKSCIWLKLKIPSNKSKGRYDSENWKHLLCYFVEKYASFSLTFVVWIYGLPFSLLGFVF
jgi:hypothetical protein